jgi:hypothetical protein
MWLLYGAWASFALFDWRVCQLHQTHKMIYLCWQAWASSSSSWSWVNCCGSYMEPGPHVRFLTEEFVSCTRHIKWFIFVGRHGLLLLLLDLELTVVAPIWSLGLACTFWLKSLSVARHLQTFWNYRRAPIYFIRSVKNHGEKIGGNWRMPCMLN